MITRTDSLSPSSARRFQAIAFDLDDTLLDTSGLLIPAASLRTYETLKDLLLQLTFSEFEARRVQLAKSLSHPEIFAQILEEVRPGARVLFTDRLSQATLAFYQSPIPAHLPLLPGALENLTDLKDKYQLFLVTSGVPTCQQQKIQACGLDGFFVRSFLVDSMKHERKQGAFEQILNDYNIEPHRLLSIGNRLSLEIRDAKLCGAMTCHFRYGEHDGEVPTQLEDIPDFTIHHHQEFIRQCQL